MRKKIIRIPMRSLVLIAVIATTFHSCKKTDTLKPKPDVAERFFSLPADASPALKRIIADLKQKNEEHPFVENFVAREGYPLWNYARMPIRKHSALSRDNADGTDTIIDVPVVLDAATFVKDILSIKLSSDILYKLFKGDEYGSYGFDKDPDRPVPNADDVVARIMAFEHDIWAQNIFKVTDNRLFDYWPQGVTKPESFYISQKLIAYNIAITWVCDFTTGGQLADCPPGVDHCFNLVPVYCEDSWTVSTWDSEGGGDDDGGWTTIPSGDGSSGVGGSNPPDPNAPPNHLPGPCEGGRAWVRIVRDEQTGVWKNPCTDEPVLIPDSPQDPCVVAQNAAKKMDTLYNLGKAGSTLALITDLSTGLNEKGFVIFQKYDVNGQNVHDTTFTVYNTSPLFTGTDSFINFSYSVPYLSVVRSFFHTHPAKGYPAQSAFDIYRLIENTMDEPHTTGNFVAAADGSQYAITVTDPYLALQFLNTKSQNLDGDKWKEDSEIEKAFEQAKIFFKNKYNGNVNQNNLAYEMAMAAVMQQFNTGITLSKKNASGNFKPIVVNTTTDTHHPRRKIYTQDCL